jgi:tyrosine-protein phosphatase SIW14
MPAYRALLPEVPPLNFAMVAPGMYRSGYPNARNFGFLRAMRLKTIIFLGPDDYLADNVQFAAEQGIIVRHIPMPGNIEPFVSIDDRSVGTALRAMVDEGSRPLLIHCNKGKYRTGCVVGCYRKLQNWSLASIFEEYRRHAESQGGDGARVLDQQFIELFDCGMLCAAT